MPRPLHLAAVAVTLLSLLAVVAPPAQAQVVAVEAFEGKYGKRVQTYVYKALKKRSQLLTSKDLDRLATDRGARDFVNADRRNIAVAEGITAFLAGTVEKKGRRWSATIRVLRASDSQELGSHVFKGRSLKRLLRSVKKTLWKKLGPAIERGEAPTAAPDPVPALASVAPLDEPTTKVETEVEVTEEERPPSATRALDVSIGPRVFGRWLSYSENQSTIINDYEAAIMPALEVAFDWHPAAHFTDGFAAQIGLTGRFEMALGISSEDEDGTEFPTTALAYAVGAHVAFPIGTSALTVGLGYAHRELSIDDADSTPKPVVPSVAYDALSVDVGARLQLLDWFAVLVGGGYQAILGSGEIGGTRFFPDSSAHGLVGHLAVATALGSAFEIRLSGDLRHYLHDLTPNPDADLDVGSAGDTFIGGSLVLAYRLAGD